jgi:Fe2+ or Zn2+ uptake regulation protein
MTVAPHKKKKKKLRAPRKKLQNLRMKVTKKRDVILNLLSAPTFQVK